MNSLVDWLNLVCKENPLLVIYFYLFYLFLEDFPSLGVVLQRSDDEPKERSSGFDTRYLGECKVSALLELDLFVSVLFLLCFIIFLICFLFHYEFPSPISPFYKLKLALFFDITFSVL